MFLRSFVFVTVAWIILLAGCAGKRKWDYEALSFEPYTLNSDLLNFEGRLKRMAGGEIGYAGVLEWKYDVDETTMVEGLAFRSTSGSEDDYKPMPWSVPKQPFYQFMDSFYKDMVYSNIQGCSNLPEPESINPWPRDTYKFIDCVPTGDGMPEIAPQGYYKINLSVTGEVEWGFVTVVKITDKLIMS